MELQRRLVSGSGWSIAGVVVNQIVGLVVLAVLARQLDAQAFGLVAIVLVTLELTQDLMIGGVPDYLVKKRIWDEQAATSGFIYQIAMAVLLAVAFAGAGVVLLQLDQRDLGHIFVALAPIYLTDAVASVPAAKLRHDMRFSSLALGHVAANVVAGAIAIVVVLNGGGFWALVAHRAALSLMTAVVVPGLARWRPQSRASWAMLKSLLLFSSPVAGSRFLSVLNMRVVDILVGLIGGTALLGMYQLAGRGISLLLQTILAPMQSMTLSALSMAKDRGAELVRIVSMLAFLIIPAAAGLAAVSPQVVHVMFGEGWNDLILPFAIMAFAAIPAIFNYTVVPALIASGHPGDIFRFTALLTALSGLFTLISAPFGIAAVAAGFVLRTLLGSVFALRLLVSRADMPARQLTRPLLRPLIGGAAVFITVLILRRYVGGLDLLYELALLILAGVLVYALICGPKLISQVRAFSGQAA